ncbi:MAG: sugar-binding protein [Candidatus Omnitrophota bacterium]
MKKRNLEKILVILGMIIGLSKINLSAEITGEKNLIVNGGFETAGEWKPGKLPETWGMWNYKTLKEGEIILDSQVKHTGNYSVKFTNSAHGLEQHIRVKAGERYNFSFYVKTTLTTGGMGFSVQWLDTEGKWVTREAFESEKDKPWVVNGRVGIGHNSNWYSIRDWQKAELSDIKVPETAVIAYIQISPIVLPVTGEFWVDDVVMEPVTAKETMGEIKSLVTISKTDTPPILDGKLTEAIWGNSTEITHFTVATGLNTLARKQTLVKLCYDNKALYVGIQCEEPKPDKLTIKAKKHDDAQTYFDDCIEIFLAPEGAGKKQFHLLVNPAGVCQDRTELWKETTVEADDAWNLNESDIVASIGEKTWTVEAKIPFADLGITAPTNSETWGFNVCRNSQLPELEQSSWSLLNTLAFQRPEGFGRLVFEEKAPGIRSYGISEQQGSFYVSNSSNKQVSLNFSIEEQEGTFLWPLAQGNIVLGPSKQQIVPLTLTKPAGSLLWASVYSADSQRILYREGYLPMSSYAVIGWYDPEKVLGNKMYVASDLRSFKCFSITHNFEGGAGNPKLIRREQKPVDLYFELPEEIQAISQVMFVNDWQWWQPISPAEKIPFNRGNKKYVRYKFELPAIMNYDNIMAVFFETSLPPGEKRDGSCYLKWEGGQQSTRPLEIETLNIGRTPPLKKFVHGIYYAPPEFWLTWLPNLGEMFPKLGLNLVEIDPVPAGKYDKGSSGLPGSREEWFDELVKEADKGKIFISTDLSASTPYAWRWVSDETARSLNIKGEPITDSRGYGYSLCPLYRGKFFQEYINNFTNGVPFQKYKISWLSLDLELWTDEAWEEGCFCERCLNAFKQYTVEKYPGEDVGDPRQFMLNPETHPKPVKIWKEFRAGTRLTFISDIRKPIEEIVLKHGRQTSPKPGLTLSDWYWPNSELFSVVDYFESNLYYRPTEVARRLGIYLERAKGKKIIIGTPSPGQAWLPDARLTPQEMRYNIFECAAAGVQGMRWYWILCFDALKIKTMVEGIRTIQPFEDIVLEGECFADLPCEGKETSARGIKLGSESLVIVRSYETTKKVEAKVTLPFVKEESVVFDCYTKEKVGRITPQNSQIILPITTERARLFYIGSETNLERRFQN